MILYHKVSTLLVVAEACRELFCKKNKSLENLPFRDHQSAEYPGYSNIRLEVSRRIVRSQSGLHFLRLLGHAMNLSGVDASPQEAAELNASVLMLDYLVLTLAVAHVTP